MHVTDSKHFWLFCCCVFSFFIQNFSQTPWTFAVSFVCEFHELQKYVILWTFVWRKKKVEGIRRKRKRHREKVNFILRVKYMIRFKTMICIASTVPATFLHFYIPSYHMQYGQTHEWKFHQTTSNFKIPIKSFIICLAFIELGVCELWVWVWVGKEKYGPEWKRRKRITTILHSNFHRE